MNIIISNEKIEYKQLKPFTPVFERLYISVDEDFKQNNGFQLTSKNIKKIFNVVNYSWDGDIYIFKKEDQEKVLSFLDEWFNESNNHGKSQEQSIVNFLLVKYSENALIVIDTQKDMSSSFDSFLKKLEEKHSEISYSCFSDSHLIDNMYLGRESNECEFETLYFLYKEGVIDESFFLRGFEIMGSEDYEDNHYYNIVSKEKPIVITGKLAIERDEIIDNLNDAEYETSEKVTANTWLWYGDKVGSNKIDAAKEKKAVYNSINEVIEQAYKQYLENKNKPRNSNKIN